MPEDTTAPRAAPAPSARLGSPATHRVPREDSPIDTATLLSAVALAAAVALAVTVLVLAGRVRGLERSLEALTRGEDGRSLAGVIETHLDKVYAIAREVDILDARTATLEREGRKAFQRLGLVRYNPFEDTGGNQSFVLALLDADGDGTILTSLHTRQATRFYAKSVRGGKPEAALSVEEAEALRVALGG